MSLWHKVAEVLQMLHSFFSKPVFKDTTFLHLKPPYTTVLTFFNETPTLLFQRDKEEASLNSDYDVHTPGTIEENNL